MMTLAQVCVAGLLCGGISFQTLSPHALFTTLTVLPQAAPVEPCVGPSCVVVPAVRVPVYGYVPSYPPAPAPVYVTPPPAAYYPVPAYAPGHAPRPAPFRPTPVSSYRAPSTPVFRPSCPPGG